MVSPARGNEEGGGEPHHVVRGARLGVLMPTTPRAERVAEMMCFAPQFVMGRRASHIRSGAIDKAEEVLDERSKLGFAGYLCTLYACTATN